MAKKITKKSFRNNACIYRSKEGKGLVLVVQAGAGTEYYEIGRYPIVTNWARFERASNEFELS